MISTLELARHCKVSQGTVDRALHNRAGISPATRERILAAASTFGFRPHPAAREIITGKSMTLHAIVPAVNNVFFMDVIHALSEAMQERNLQFQISIVRDEAALLRTLADSAARRHQMVIIIPPKDNITIPADLTIHMPVVSLFSPCLGENVTFISPDEVDTGREGVDYLVSKGHRKIVFLSFTRTSYAISARSEGYQTRMRELKLQPQVYSQMSGNQLLEVLETDQPTAFFCHNDWLAIRTILSLRECGIRVPEDISVLGVDNSPTLSGICPELTTLSYPTPAIIDSVVAVLDGAVPVGIKTPLAIIERNSVQPRTNGKRLRR